MKALVLTKYGSPNAFQINDIAKPTPKENEVLIKIYATAVNDYDWCLMRGKPYIYRLMFGITKPKNPVPGMELAGVLEGVGENANLFNVGDAVYGDISDYGFGTAVFNIVVVFIYAATFKSPHSFSGFSQTLSGKSQFLVLPDQRFGFANLAAS